MGDLPCINLGPIERCLRNLPICRNMPITRDIRIHLQHRCDSHGNSRMDPSLLSFFTIMALTGLGAKLLFIPLILAVICCKLAFWIVFSYQYSQSLSHVPGPRWASWTRLWIVKVLASGDSAQKFVEVNQLYGPLVSFLVILAS